MPWIIALAFIAIVALIIVQPRRALPVLALAAGGRAIVAWMKFRPRRSQR